jgi:hypothetical protein
MNMKPMKNVLSLNKDTEGWVEKVLGRIPLIGSYSNVNLFKKLDTFDGVKPRFLNRGKKCRSVSTLSEPPALERG